MALTLELHYIITYNVCKLTCIRSRDNGWTVSKVIISM